MEPAYYVHFVDYEPIRPRWGDLGQQDVWGAAIRQGGPQLARKRMEERLHVLDSHGVPVSWCVDAWWPNGEWFEFNFDLTSRRMAQGDRVSPHFHWVWWSPKLHRWIPQEVPDLTLATHTIDRQTVLAESFQYNGEIIRGGWCTTETDEGFPIWKLYKRQGFKGAADFRHGDIEWEADDFLRLGYDNRNQDGPLIIHWEHVPPDPKEDERLDGWLKQCERRFGDRWMPVTADLLRTKLLEGGR